MIVAERDGTELANAITTQGMQRRRDGAGKVTVRTPFTGSDFANPNLDVEGVPIFRRRSAHRPGV
jgi:hypothetical protein